MRRSEREEEEEEEEKNHTGNAPREHLLDRRSCLRCLGAVASDETLALEEHAILNSNATAELVHAVEVGVGDGLGMIKEPAQKEISDERKA